MSRPSTLPALAFALLAACSGTPTAHAPASFADELREKLANAEDEVQRGTILDELAKVELARARDANTIFAYRRFLAEFPVGEEATTARSLLESLRFSEADKAGTRAAWEAFLEEHPDGRRSPEARAKLGAIAIAEAVASDDLALVRRTLSTFPEHAAKPSLVAHEDALSWAVARKGTRDDVAKYLAEHPGGVYRNDADLLIESLDEQEVLDTEDLARARRRATAGDARPTAKRTLALLELRLAERAFDTDALARVVASTANVEAASDVHARAKALLDSLTRVPPTPELLSTITAARPGAGLRTRDELRTVLQEGDPLDRVDALREVAERADPADLDLLLEAIDSRYVAVRLAAIEALRSDAATLPKPVWTSIAKAKEQEALAKALSAGPWRRVAALRDAAGRTQDALSAWREVLRNEPDDIAARSRLLDLERQLGDRLGFASAARELAKSAAAFGEDRWLTPQDAGTPAEARRDGPGQTVGVPANVSMLRQLCAAIVLGRSSSGALVELRAEATTAMEQELLGLATSDLERALVRLEAKRTELEREAKRGDPAFVSCGAERGQARVDVSRKSRAEAIRRLGTLADRRALAFVQSLAVTPSLEVRAAVAEAVAGLEAAPPEPPAPPPAPVPAAPPAKPKRR